MPATEYNEYTYSRPSGGDWTDDGSLLQRSAGQAPPPAPATSGCSLTVKLCCAAVCAMTLGIVGGVALQLRLQAKMLHRPGQSSASADSAKQTGIPMGNASGQSAQQTIHEGTTFLVATSSTTTVLASIAPTSAAVSTPAITTDLTTTVTSKATEHEKSVDDTLEPAEERDGTPPYVNHFYMYRVQNDEDYSPENQNMASIGGALWYLHNEIVIHHWNRGGTYASTPKTRIERFEVKTRATPKLYKRGMNFGVVNTYDLGKCTGPFKCENVQEYGPVVGCEQWQQGKNLKYNNTFPHQQWVGKNLYPNAIWYSLPGACSSHKFWNQVGHCGQREPSGACPPGVTPTGEKDCTYSYKKIGEIRISDLEGIKSFNDLVVNGGREYDPETDAGVNMHFWDDVRSVRACQERIDRVIRLFQDKYPEQRTLEDPICDFDVNKFYPNFPLGDFPDQK